MENIIIECSRFDAVSATSNASWTTNIPKGITINNGDIITIRNCFINSNTSDAENIEIPEDLSLKFVIGYYDVNYGSLSNIGVNNIDYDMYIAYNENIGTVGTLLTVSFRCEYDGNVGESLVLNAIVTFKETNGNFYSLTWGVDDPPSGGIKMPDVKVPKPPTGNHINVTAQVGYTNVVLSSLTARVYTEWTQEYLGAQWGGQGQYGLSLNTGFGQIDIPKGEYTRTGIAKFITDKLQFASPMFATSSIDIRNDFLRRTDQSENHLGIEDYSAFSIGDQSLVLLAESFEDLDDVYATGLDFGQLVGIEYTLLDEDGNLAERITTTATIESEANNGINVEGDGTVTIRFTTNIFNLDDSYVNGYLVVNVSSDNMVFKRVGFDPTDPETKKYNYPNPTYYGSSENVLYYDPDKSVFSWQYLHMPYYAQDPPTISIRQEKNTNSSNEEAYNKYYTVTQLGGVFFIDLQPISFWESLGFTADQLLVPIQPNLMINRFDLEDRITMGYSSLASLINTANPKEVPTTLASDIATTDTTQITGSSLDDVSTGGFYLIDINLGSQNYMFQKGNKNNIQAIVSKYNQIRDYITGYSDSSIGYQHFGAPFDLQTVNINILDPESKLPDKDIGDKSTVFIQVTRNPQPSIKN